MGWLFLQEVRMEKYNIPFLNVTQLANPCIQYRAWNFVSKFTNQSITLYIGNEAVLNICIWHFAIIWAVPLTP